MGPIGKKREACSVPESGLESVRERRWSGARIRGENRGRFTPRWTTPRATVLPLVPADSFLKALFDGVVLDQKLFPYPVMTHHERDDVSGILSTVQRLFAAHVDSPRIDREAEIPKDVLDRLAALGLFGLGVPRDLGGLGLSNFASARIVQEVAGLDGSIAATIGAHQSLGTRGIFLFGTEEQKRHYIPDLARGARIAAFALTEPGAGSDANGIQTRATLKGDEYVLRGSKIWTSNGAIADVFVVFARTSAPSSGSKPRLTAFLVDRAHGVRTGPNEPKLGIRGNTTTEVFLDDVVVPKSAVLGEAGHGFKIAMQILNDGRLGLAAGCVGSAKTLVQLSIARVQERRAFGRSIGEFALIKDKIAGMLAETYALESMVYLTCNLADRQGAHGNAGQLDYAMESAICKVFGSEVLWRIANESLQIAAGSGYMASFPYERLLRDARVNLIFYGTNEILRCFIALAGVQGPGRALNDLGKALREPVRGFALLSDFALRQAKNAIAREKLHGAHAALAGPVARFEHYVDAFGKQVQRALRRYGRNIGESQFTLERIADMAIQLYALAACFSRATRVIHERGEEGGRRELEMTRVFSNLANERLEETLRGFDANDDDLRCALAAKSYVDGVYPLDVV